MSRVISFSSTNRIFDILLILSPDKATQQSRDRSLFRTSEASSSTPAGLCTARRNLTPSRTLPPPRGRAGWGDTQDEWPPAGEPLPVGPRDYTSPFGGS